MPTLGIFTVDTIDGMLQPAAGVRVWTFPPPGGIDASRASPVVSKIKTARKFATAALAAAATQAYRDTVGGAFYFDGTTASPLVLVERIEPDHMASLGEAGGALAVCTWYLIAEPGWVPTLPT